MNLQQIKEKADVLSNMELFIWCSGTIQKEKGKVNIEGVKKVLFTLRPNVDWNVVINCAFTEGLVG